MTNIYCVYTFSEHHKWSFAKMNAETAYLTVPQVAEILGLHPESVRKMIREGRLPAFKAGRSWRFDPADLEEWRRKQRETCSVLIVDDEDRVCRVLARLISKLGCTAAWETEGVAGLSRARDIEPDLVLLDLVMPGMSGPDFLGEFRKDFPETPVVIVTGYPDSDLMQHAMEHPPISLLSKPVDHDKFARTIRALLKEKLPRAS